LAASEDEERRSSGRAILMLLDRIGELERELARREQDDVPRPPPPRRPPEPEPDDPPSSLEDTQPIGLRDRLRLATGRLHER
jgi:hypothetical protein